MKSRVVATVLAIICLLTWPAFGADSIYDESWQPQPGATSRAPIYGFRFQENQSDNAQHSYAQAGNTSASIVPCDSFEPTACPLINRNVNVILPACETKLSEFCVESLSIRLKDEKEYRSAKYLRTVSTKILMASDITGTPYGSGVSVWKNPFEGAGQAPEFGVGISLLYVPMTRDLVTKTWDTKLSILNMSANVTPVYTVSGKYAPFSVRFYDGQLRGGYFDTTETKNAGTLACVWQETGLCAKKTSFVEGSRIKLVARIPSDVDGWFHGRFVDPQINLEKISETANRLTVEADAATVPTTGFLAGYEELTPDMKSLLETHGIKMRSSGSGGESSNVSTSDERAFKYLDYFSIALGDKSSALKTRWTFQSVIERAPPSCANKFKGVKGIVSTNAMVYEGFAPSFDGSTLNYKVGGLHFNPNGTPFLGSYDLIMRSDVARCYYGFSSAPISATVEVASSDGTKQIATTVVGEKDGWLKLGAYGFQFSNPTIRVSLKQEVIADAVPQLTKKKITCIKGKSIKTVTAVNPKCPTGYKVK